MTTSQDRKWHRSQIQWHYEQILVHLKDPHRKQWHHDQYYWHSLQLECSREPKPQ